MMVRARDKINNPLQFDPFEYVKPLQKNTTKVPAPRPSAPKSYNREILLRWSSVSMAYNSRSENLNDKPITRKWLIEHPDAAARFEHVLKTLRHNYTGDNHGYIDKPQYRFNDKSTGGYVIVVAQVNRVLVIFEPGSPGRKRFEVHPATFDVDVQNLLTNLSACKPRNFDWSKGFAIGVEHENEESAQPDELQQRAIKIRRGQRKFRDSLLAAYGESCAISGCNIIELLEAAHIRPHAEKPNYNVTNESPRVC